MVISDAKKSSSAGASFMATRLRHIAIIVPDPETAAQFFEQAFDMKRAGSGRRGIYMSDGVMNVALLKRETDKEQIGLYHFGMWVDDLAESEKKVFDAGGTYLAGRPTSPNSYYEAKYKDPLGIVFDLTHTGWIGAAKDVVAADAPATDGHDGHVKDAAKA
jgi:lactoylglutathione lyase